MSRHAFLLHTILFQITLLVVSGSLSAQFIASPFSNGSYPSAPQQAAGRPPATFQPVTQQRIQVQPMRQKPIQTGMNVPMNASPADVPPTNTQPAGMYPNHPTQNPAAYPQNRLYPQAVPQRTVPAQNALQPIRIAQSEASAGQSARQSYMLYDPNNVQQSPSQPTSVQPVPLQRQSAPAQPIPSGIYSATPPINQVVPFNLTPAEQRELDEFLAQWEKTSSGIKRYDVNFDLFEYDPTIPGAAPNQPARICFGYFKYINNPVRFVYVVEGEWRGKDKMKRDANKNPGIFAEKTIIAEKAVYKYDYNSNKIYQINVPPELIGKGIADSPLPLIFGAKANELKRRFSMKTVTTKDSKTNEDIIWLYARPLLIEDQQEFKELNVMLVKKDLRAVALKQHDINEKSYKVFSLSDTKINSRLDDVIEDMRKFFTPITERGWETVVMDWNAAAPSPPNANVGIPQPQIGNPATYPYPNSNPNTHPSPYRNEVPLYQL